MIGCVGSKLGDTFPEVSTWITPLLDVTPLVATTGMVFVIAGLYPVGRVNADVALEPPVIRQAI
jgi:hypothetical protein